MNRILIVEDESRIAAFIEKGLQKNGFDTAIATDGEQALQMAESNDFDMLLLDLGLPIKDGWTVLQELRDRGKKIPVIIVSARDDIEGKRTGLQNGAISYVTKPFRFNVLLQSVRVHLNNCAVS
jgi:two-component system, OmpR family, copper resistance phosphate regulon response regulator CusR